MSEQVIRPEGIPSGEAFGTPTIGMRAYLSTQHLWAAEHFARLAGELEAAHTGEPRFSAQHRAYVLGAVCESVFFLEAFINELLQDAKDAVDDVDGPGAVDGLPLNAVRLMAAYWNSTEDDNKHVQAIPKYDAAGVFAGHPRSDSSREPHQHLKVLIDLRNWSVHYRPRTMSADNPYTRFDQARTWFTENVLMAGSKNTWFPDKALGADCARWAVKTVRAFVDEFVDTVGCRANYRDLGPLGEQP